MRRVILIFVSSAIVAACGGAAGPTPVPSGGGPTSPPAQATATPPGQPTAPPAQGGTTVSVTLTGGADAGSYTGTADPGCAVGFMGSGVWSVNYSILDGSTAGTLSEVIVVYDPASGGMVLTVGIGPIYDTANGFMEYEIESNIVGHNNIGSGTVQLNDAGATATLHATGSTADGVGLDATATCPSITRG